MYSSSRFARFLEQLKDQVTLAEYTRLCDKQGRVGLREAALLLIGSTTPAQAKQLGRKAMALPGHGAASRLGGSNEDHRVFLAE